MRNLTIGKPLKLIVLFTIPLLIGNLFQQLYSFMDALIVGRTIGKAALAAVGATSSIVFDYRLCARYDSRTVNLDSPSIWST